MIDRSEASRAMAKAIAYKQCGKDTDAAQWARELVRILQCADILGDENAINDLIESRDIWKAEALENLARPSLSIEQRSQPQP